MYGATVNPTWNNNFVPEEDKGGEEGAGGQPTGVRSTKMFAVVACLNLESWRFHTPLVQFTLNTNELVMGMHLGPVQRQTLTRGVFVQTTNQLRVFSLETGNEIISNGLPVTLSNLSKSKKTFKPLLGALCPLQVHVIGSGLLYHKEILQNSNQVICLLLRIEYGNFWLCGSKHGGDKQDRCPCSRCR